MENNVIPLSIQFDAVHPVTGKPVKVVGVDMSDPHVRPKLVVLSTGLDGTRAEVVDYVENKRQ